MQSPLYCPACHSLRPAESVDHYRALGLAPAFDIDADELRRRYLQLSRETHPDRSGADADGLRVSAQLNEAYRVLADPLSRAEYLLELLGGASAQRVKTVPQDVLAQTLMLRDAIEEARDTGDERALAEARHEATAAFDACAARIRDLAGRLQESPDAGAMRELRLALNSVRYYQRALAQFDRTP